MSEIATTTAYLRNKAGKAQREAEYQRKRAERFERENRELRTLLKDVYLMYVQGHDWPWDDTAWVKQRMRDLGLVDEGSVMLVGDHEE